MVGGQSWLNSQDLYKKTSNKWAVNPKELARLGLLKMQFMVH